MSSGQQPVTQQTTQTRDPWIGAQGGLTQVQQAASNLYNTTTGYLPWSGQTLASLDPTLSQGLASQGAIAQQNLGGTPGILAAQNLGLQQIQQGGQTQNPYLQSILATNNRQIGDRVNSSMSGAGRYGSGQHTDVMTRALAESANPILAEDYTAGLQRAGQWAQLMPTLDQAQYQPAQTLTALGQYNQDRAQQQLSDQIKLYNAQQSWPWEQLARYSAIASGAGGLGGTQVTSAPVQQPSLLQSGLGGAAAGAGIGSIFGAPGAAAGGIGGGLLGLLGR